jgi:hypothetical protein
MRKTQKKNSTFVYKKGFSTCQIYFITYTNSCQTGRNNNQPQPPLTEDQKNTLVSEALKEYEQAHPKPQFVNPGYPDAREMANRSANIEEHQKRLDTFKEEYSVQKKIDNHNTEAKAYVVEKLNSTHPELAPEEIIAKVEHKQSADLPPSHEYGDYQDIQDAKEAKWKERLDQDAFEVGEHLKHRSCYSEETGPASLAPVVQPPTPSAEGEPAPSNNQPNQPAPSNNPPVPSNNEAQESENISAYWDWAWSQLESTIMSWSNKVDEQANPESPLDQPSSVQDENEGELEHRSLSEPRDLDSSSPENLEANGESSSNREEEVDKSSSDNGKEINDQNNENENKKRPLSSEDDQNYPNKKLKTEEEEEESNSKAEENQNTETKSKQSPLDFALEKEATEMPSIFDADGGD